MYYVLTVNKHGDKTKVARITCEKESLAKTLQINLIVRGHAVKLTEQEDLPQLDHDELVLSRKFLEVGAPPLSPAVLGRAA